MMRLTTLENGLRVATRAMPGIETAAVGLYAEAGSRHEPAPLNGIAHLYEHMVFKGAGGRSAREISEAIEDVGGELNACTERDGTSFTASVLAEHVPLAVELVADMILRPAFDEEELEREKDVVLQELGEARDTPNDIIFDELWEAAFAAQPLGRSILGDEQSIERIAIDDLHRWRTERYRAGSLTLCAAGKVDHDALVALAEARFAGLPDGTIAEAEPASFTGGTRIGRVRAEQAHLALGFQGAAQLDEDYFAHRFFSDIIGGGASSRLFQKVREERGLAYSIYSVLHSHAETGIVYVYAAAARREGTAAAQLVEEVIADAAATATVREVERARTQARASLLMSLESPWGQANYLARQLHVYGRLVDPEEVVADLAKVQVDQVRAAGARILAGPRARATIGFPAVRAA
jgi:predicted Zn-dependent peptidase